ncbi:MAG: hypothetical protein PVSMB6_12260 [Steroidobacteraceae bacterium]
MFITWLTVYIYSYCDYIQFTAGGKSSWLPNRVWPVDAEDPRGYAAHSHPVLAKPRLPDSAQGTRCVISTRPAPTGAMRRSD